MLNHGQYDYKNCTTWRCTPQDNGAEIYVGYNTKYMKRKIHLFSSTALCYSIVRHNKAISNYTKEKFCIIRGMADTHKRPGQRIFPVRVFCVTPMILEWDLCSLAESFHWYCNALNLLYDRFACCSDISTKTANPAD